MTLFLAIALGLLFGFALNRAGATNPQNIINMLRLTDTSLMKSILFAIGLASLVMFIGLQFGLIDAAHLSVKKAYLGVLLGGALLGIGFAIAGYCPGTGLAALATGRKDAILFTIGGLFGALLFTILYGNLKETTSLFEPIFGGDTTIAATGSEKYTALLGDINGLLIGGAMAILFIAIAWLLPKQSLGKK